jgi:hypothetical protein
LELLITNEVCLFFNRLKSLRYDEGDFERKRRELPENSLCKLAIMRFARQVKQFCSEAKNGRMFYMDGFGLRFGERESGAQAQRRRNGAGEKRPSPNRRRKHADYSVETDAARDERAFCGTEPAWS